MWYFIRSKEGRETKLCQLLHEKQIDCYCPIRLQEGIEHKTEINTIFPGYVFIRCVETKLKELNKVRYFHGLVFWKNQPLTVPDDYINSLKSFTARHSLVRVEKVEIMDSNADTVRRTIHESHIELHLPLMGYKLIGKKTNNLRGQQLTPIRLQDRGRFTELTEEQ